MATSRRFFEQQGSYPWRMATIRWISAGGRPIWLHGAFDDEYQVVWTPVESEKEKEKIWRNAVSLTEITEIVLPRAPVDEGYTVTRLAAKTGSGRLGIGSSEVFRSREEAVHALYRWFSNTIKDLEKAGNLTLRKGPPEKLHQQDVIWPIPRSVFRRWAKKVARDSLFRIVDKGEVLREALQRDAEKHLGLFYEVENFFPGMQLIVDVDGPAPDAHMYVFVVPLPKTISVTVTIPHNEETERIIQDLAWQGDYYYPHSFLPHPYSLKPSAIAKRVAELAKEYISEEDGEITVEAETAPYEAYYVADFVKPRRIVRAYPRWSFKPWESSPEWLRYMTPESVANLNDALDSYAEIVRHDDDAVVARRGIGFFRPGLFIEYFLQKGGKVDFSSPAVRQALIRSFSATLDHPAHWKRWLYLFRRVYFPMSILEEFVGLLSSQPEKLEEAFYAMSSGANRKVRSWVRRLRKKKRAAWPLHVGGVTRDVEDTLRRWHQVLSSVQGE